MPKEKMKITKHALERYRQRTGATCSDTCAELKISQMLERAEEVQLKPRYKTAALLCHKFEPANYYRVGNLIFVVVNDCLTTIHLNDKRKFQL
jgi:hypothetical protein